ncbi:MAG: DUF3352 domain-containing protein, partial [Cyanobacteria bacterium J06649_4]
SLLNEERFTQAIAPLPPSQTGYVYFDWRAISPMLAQAIPAFSLVQSAGRPFFAHVDTVAAAREEDLMSIFVKLKASQAISQDTRRPYQ